MSLGGSEEAFGHNRGLLGGNEDVLEALLRVNQNSFEHLACLVGAPGAQGRAQDPQKRPPPPRDQDVVPIFIKFYNAFYDVKM